MTIQQKIFCPSFPRSGCGYLRQCVGAVLGDEFRANDETDAVFRPEYHNWIKTHDFNLNEVAPPRWRTIVQIRHPIEAIASWWDFQLATGGIKPEDDRVEVWQQWSLNACRLWSKFVRRWVFSEAPDVVIRLKDLCRHPTVYTGLVVGIMRGDAEHIIVPRDVSIPDVRPPSRWENFHFHDPEWEQIMWETVGVLAGTLGYRRIA